MGIDLNGVLVVDKPSDMTSARLVAVLKKRIGAGKIGHTGTLDPFATGVMVICLGKATRLARFFLHGDKRYRATMVLGAETDTLDATGQTVATSDDIQRSDEEILAAMEKFEGRILQKPPVFSALKHKGTPLYKLARQGRPVQKPPREVVIHVLRLLGVSLPAVQLDVACSGGTYIRSLCADIGRELGCGAHLRDLRRTESCGFSIEQGLSLEAVDALADRGRIADAVIPMSAALEGMSTLTVNPETAAKVLQGVVMDDWMLDGDALTAGTKALFEGVVKVEDSTGNLLAVIEKEKSTGFYRYCCVFS
jgi:tRNA pseudouridine55 synthase